MDGFHAQTRLKLMKVQKRNKGKSMHKYVRDPALDTEDKLRDI